LKKILFVFGTRPEAIKMAPVISAFKKNRADFKILVAVTAQHREMLDQILTEFNIVPDYDLDLMSKNQTLESLTGKILNSVSKLLIDTQPDLIFVQGDTTTTFASSLAAFYQKIPIGHIEAGLRTKNIYSPFPEEINRRMISTIASFHFPATQQAQQNLLNEGINKETITVTGNTVVDALLTMSEKLDTDLSIYEEFFSSKYGITFNRQKTILVTGHRRENFGQGFENIFYAIKHIAVNNNVQIIYPVHLNPNVQEPAIRVFTNLDNVYLIPPQDYISFIFLMKKSYIILTDSGGVQEEAPSIGKPVLIIRETTERQEGVDALTAKLVGTNPEKIISSVELLINDKAEYYKMARAVNPYGNGDASKIIQEVIKKNV
jgi:UDP-N-acetylglucosamine 2-epimerase (non-hydrolysing)